MTGNGKHGYSHSSVGQLPRSGLGQAGPGQPHAHGAARRRQWRGGRVATSAIHRSAQVHSYSGGRVPTSNKRGPASLHGHLQAPTCITSANTPSSAKASPNGQLQIQGWKYRCCLSTEGASKSHCKGMSRQEWRDFGATLQPIISSSLL